MPEQRLCDIDCFVIPKTVAVEMACVQFATDVSHSRINYPMCFVATCRDVLMVSWLLVYTLWG